MSTTVACRNAKLVGKWCASAVRSAIWENIGDAWLVPREGSGLDKELFWSRQVISWEEMQKIPLFQKFGLGKAFSGSRWRLAVGAFGEYWSLVLVLVYFYFFVYIRLPVDGSSLGWTNRGTYLRRMLSTTRQHEVSLLAPLRERRVYSRRREGTPRR